MIGGLPSSCCRSEDAEYICKCRKPRIASVTLSRRVHSRLCLFFFIRLFFQIFTSLSSDTRFEALNMSQFCVERNSSICISDDYVSVQARTRADSCALSRNNMYQACIRIRHNRESECPHYIYAAILGSRSRLSTGLRICEECY